MKANNTQRELILYGLRDEYNKFQKDFENRFTNLKIGLKDFEFKHLVPGEDVGRDLFNDIITLHHNQNKLSQDARDLLSDF